MAETKDRVAWEGRFLRVVLRGGTYECVQRRKISGIVGIIPLTDDGRVILVEQFRPAMNARVIELPAGLAGDVAGREREPLEQAARRELLEETGYEAAEMTFFCDGASSAGMSDEIITLFVARGLRRVGPGGGDASEDIAVHEVPLAELRDWLAARRRLGNVIDLKVYSVLGLCTS